MKTKGILMNESVLHFANGEAIQGEDSIGNFIMSCCAAYARGREKAIIKGFAIGAVVGCAVLTTTFVIKKIKESHNKQEES